jgi:16S rRNA (guanine(1405)-N(7))-methyltransferase
MSDQDLERLVEAVRSTHKYRTVAPDLVRDLGARELAKGRGWKEAVKATKRRLHQVAGAYMDMGPRYPEWLRELRAASPDGFEPLRAACAEVMKHHSSTRERLPLLDEFYPPLLAGLPPIRAVLDIGCGLHPLALPWMGLPAGVEYTALDIYEDMAAFLTEFLALLPVRGHAEARDILQSLPPEHVDLALLFKTVACLEHVDREAGRRLLEAVPADVLLVSFPAQSLTGRRGKGMEVNYEAHFRELVAGKDWRVDRFEFSTELVFRVFKGGPGDRP